MLRLNEASLGARVTSDDVTRASRASGELLAQVQKGEVCYRGSLGWLHVDEWASVEQLVRVAELARRVRADLDEGLHEGDLVRLARPGRILAQAKW